MPHCISGRGVCKGLFFIALVFWRQAATIEGQRHTRQVSLLSVKLFIYSMVVGSGCIYPSVVESFAWFLYISSPW